MAYAFNDDKSKFDIISPLIYTLSGLFTNVAADDYESTNITLSDLQAVLPVSDWSDFANNYRIINFEQNMSTNMSSYSSWIPTAFDGSHRSYNLTTGSTASLMVSVHNTNTLSAQNVGWRMTIIRIN